MNANTNTPAARTYTADDILHGVFYPITESTTASDLPDTAWLASIAVWMGSAYGVGREEAFANVTENQVLALAGRAAGYSATEIGDQAMLRHPEL